MCKMGWNPKKCSYPMKPSKSAQTLKKRSGWQKVYPSKGLPEKSATMESLGSFLRFFHMKPTSRYSVVHILSPTFRIEARTCGNRDPPPRGDHGQPLYPTKPTVLRPTVFSAVNSRFPDRSNFPTT